MRASFELDDEAAQRNQLFAAVTVSATLLIAAALAALFGRAPGPDLSPMLSIAATVWSLADLLTAFLLLAQFYVSGRIFFGVLAGAYAYSGLLTWGYIATFPHVFSSAAPTPAQDQLPFVFWTIWHTTFPILVACAALLDSPLKRILSRRTLSAATALVALGPAIAAAATFTLVVTNVDAIPQLVVGNSFKVIGATPIIPVVAALNSLVCLFLLLRKRKVTPLMLWLAVATFSAALDAVMVGFSAARFSYAFDTGKVITVFTSCIVLVMLLSDVAGLYERLGNIARTDVLTSLNNRRAFEEYFAVTYHRACRLRRSVGILVIDIDLFKRYNDSYGHLAGDACLRRVAHAIGDCALHPPDFAARYGGEEFVIVLPDTQLQGILVVAERIRAAVERLAIVHNASERGHVTVSIGVGYVAQPRAGEESALFESADIALYEAKDRGGNTVAQGEVEEPTAA